MISIIRFIADWSLFKAKRLSQDVATLIIIPYMFIILPLALILHVYECYWIFILSDLNRFYKRFSLFPRRINRQWVWFSAYYLKRITIDGKYLEDVVFVKIISITEQEYLVLKLKGEI